MILTILFLIWLSCAIVFVIKTKKLVQKRIVKDRYCGYEVQTRRWWFPLWVQGIPNTHPTIEKAEHFAKHGNVVKIIE